MQDMRIEHRECTITIIRKQMDDPSSKFQVLMTFTEVMEDLQSTTNHGNGKSEIPSSFHGSIWLFEIVVLGV